MEGVPGSRVVGVKEIQRVTVSVKVHRDASFVQSGEDHPDQVAISTANGSIVEAAGVAEEVSTSVQINHDSWKNCSASEI